MEQPEDRVYRPKSYEDWDIDQAIEDALTQNVLLEESYETQTRNHLERAAPLAAQSIVQIALYSHDERRRLDAAKYIVDRQLGRIGEERNSSLQNPLEDLLAEVVQTAESFTKNS